jgi:hypothetical protein
MAGRPPPEAQTLEAIDWLKDFAMENIGLAYHLTAPIGSGAGTGI